MQIYKLYELLLMLLELPSGVLRRHLTSHFATPQNQNGRKLRNIQRGNLNWPGLHYPEEQRQVVPRAFLNDCRGILI
jgi:hypothetical protein